MLKYRSEIDGLRALAVLSVIFFHAGFTIFSGGYVGVDIFFVISGYLITSIILKEKEKQNFSLLGFYERRARRILPALFTVLLATTISAYILMPADLLKSYMQSLVSVVTFLSNIFFSVTNDYFATVADEKPLLHTWTLAIEEQYYIVFPILISSFWFLGKKRLFQAIALLALLSLLLSHILSQSSFVQHNFYFLLSRVWELLAGSLLAFVGTRVTRVSDRTKELFSVIGLLFIFYAVFFFDSNTPFPSLYTLVPVFGAMLVISFCDKHTVAARVLSTRSLAFIGLISYSLYLWHQPIYAFLRLKTLGEPTLEIIWGAMLVIFFISIFSYKYRG